MRSTEEIWLDNPIVKRALAKSPNLDPLTVLETIHDTLNTLDRCLPPGVTYSELLTGLEEGSTEEARAAAEQLAGTIGSSRMTGARVSHVLALIEEGRSNAEVAEIAGVSAQTVRRYRNGKVPNGQPQNKLVEIALYSFEHGIQATVDKFGVHRTYVSRARGRYRRGFTTWA